MSVECDGSDLHVSIGRRRRCASTATAASRLPDLSPADTKALAYSVLTDAQKKRFEETLELDFSFGIRGLARFRCNMFNQKGAVGAVYRQIPSDPTFDELGTAAGHRPARGSRAAWCWSPARPAAASRRRWPR